MPSELDEIDRKIRTLEVEKAALSKESDESSQKRLVDLNTELDAAHDLSSGAGEEGQCP